jgi:hypothetical protein
VSWVHDDARTGTADGQKSGQLQVPYIVSGPVNPVTVMMAPQTVLGGDDGATPLPALKSTHPAHGQLLLDSYSVRQDGIVTFATANYSTDGRFRFPPRFRHIEPGQGRWTITVADLETSIPYAKKVWSTRSISAGQPGEFIEIEAETWELHSEKIDETQVIRAIRVSIPEGDNIADAVAAIEAQHKSLHVIGGAAYQFRAGDITDDADGRYSTIYSWYSDPGTFLDRGPSPSPDLVFPPSGVIGFAPYLGPLTNLIRPPFHKIIAVRNRNASIAPSFELHLPLRVQSDGWATLPGLVDP